MTAMVRARLLTKNSVAWTAGAIALRVAALGHEALEYAVKSPIIVRALLHEADKIADRLGRTRLSLLRSWPRIGRP